MRTHQQLRLTCQHLLIICQHQVQCTFLTTLVSTLKWYICTLKQVNAMQRPSLTLTFNIEKGHQKGLKVKQTFQGTDLNDRCKQVCRDYMPIFTITGPDQNGYSILRTLG